MASTTTSSRPMSTTMAAARPSGGYAFGSSVAAGKKTHQQQPMTMAGQKRPLTARSTNDQPAPAAKKAITAAVAKKPASHNKYDHVVSKVGQYIRSAPAPAHSS